MNLEMAHELLSYNTWANTQLLDAVSRLDAEQFSRNLGGSYPSVHATLTHMVWAEWTWLEGGIRECSSATPPMRRQGSPSRSPRELPSATLAPPARRWAQPWPRPMAPRNLHRRPAGPILEAHWR